MIIPIGDNLTRVGILSFLAIASMLMVLQNKADDSTRVLYMHKSKYLAKQVRRRFSLFVSGDTLSERTI